MILIVLLKPKGPALGIPLFDEDGRPRSLHEMVHDPRTPYHGGPEASLAPNSLKHRYIYEELPTRVYPVRSFGSLFEVEMPMHDYVIRKTAEITSHDSWGPISRGYAYMGLSEDDILNWPQARQRFY